MVRPLPRTARRSERGAAIFVVVLAITLLTAVGMFAAHSASLVDQAAGYARLARQTQYLAEYGALASASELGSGGAELYYREMLSGAETCNANSSLNDASPKPPCAKIYYGELEQRTQKLSSQPLLKAQNDEDEDLTNPAGFVGTAHSATEGIVGDFVVELTDPGPTGAPVAGANAGGTGVGFRYVKVTATTTAQLRPPGAEHDSNIATLTSQQALRTHFVIGPIQQ